VPEPTREELFARIAELERSARAKKQRKPKSEGQTICQLCGKRVPNEDEAREYRSTLEPTEDLHGPDSPRRKIMLEFSRTYCVGHPYKRSGQYGTARYARPPKPTPNLSYYDRRHPRPVEIENLVFRRAKPGQCVYSVLYRRKDNPCFHHQCARPPVEWINGWGFCNRHADIVRRRIEQL